MKATFSVAKHSLLHGYFACKERADDGVERPIGNIST